MTTNIKAFLDMLAWSEIGPALLAKSDDGYNVLVGSTAAKPLLFTSYADHPGTYNAAIDSTAAGRYQLLKKYYWAYKASLHLPDFGKASQDAIAVQQIRERKALDDIAVGHLTVAIGKCSNIWASLPGNTYGQHTHSIIDLENAYERAGGQFA
jgi:muramidase (phage lysozyme)